MKKILVSLFVALCFTYIAITPNLSWAADSPFKNKKYEAFMKIDGIPGSSTDDNHWDWIDVIAFNTEFTKSPNQEPCFRGLYVLKALDIASPLLSFHGAIGTAFPSIVLDIKNPSASGNFYTITLKDAYITEVRNGESPEGVKIILESVIFSFASIEWKFSKGNPDGTGGGNISESYIDITPCD